MKKKKQEVRLQLKKKTKNTEICEKKTKKNTEIFEEQAYLIQIGLFFKGKYQKAEDYL